ncbi:MAG: YbhN family protein [Enterococcus sp.]
MKNSKKKLIGNFLLLAIILAIIYYLLRYSFADILAELATTSPLVLIIVILFGTLYQLAEGKSIQEIAKIFQPKFTTMNGFWTTCIVAFYRVVTFGAATILSEIYFYKKKGLKMSQGTGVTALHMIMYKAAVVTYAIIGLIIQFSLLYTQQKGMIIFVLVGVVLSILIMIVLLGVSSSVRLHVFLIRVSNRLFKSEKLRGLVDSLNLQIYSLRETIQAVMMDKTAMLRIYFWNMVKLVFWYVLPYLILMNEHHHLDFLQAFAFTSFAVVMAGVIPTPAGIGSFDFVYLLFFRPLVGTVDAVSSLLLYRFSSYLLPFIYGFFYTLVDKRKTIKEEIKESK